MYDSVDEVKQKLVGSVVLFDGHPVQIRDSAKSKSSIIIYYIKLPLPRSDMSNYELADILDPRWDFRNFGTRLGYISIKNPVNERFESLFVTRVPVRHSRQGLDDKTTMLVPCPEETGYRYSWSDIVYNETATLVHTIKNNFLSTEEAFKLLTDNKQYHSVPIHRKITFLYDQVSPPYLIYRNDKVGYSEDGKLFKLAKHKDYLREELTDQVGLKIA